jgi:hypothetical protein
MRTIRCVFLLSALTVLLGACGGGNANTKDTGDGDDLRAYGHLLGETRMTVDGQVRATGTADAKGWTPYSGGLMVQFTGEKAMGVTQPVPADMNCTDAAKWAGFSGARAPILRDHRCIWPADDVVHALGPGVAGTLDLQTRVLKVRVAQ